MREVIKANSLVSKLKKSQLRTVRTGNETEMYNTKNEAESVIAKRFITLSKPWKFVVTNEWFLSVEMHTLKDKWHCFRL